MPAPFVFATAIYGEAYAPFLNPHLHSIVQAYPDARGVVVHQDVPASEIALLRAAYPSWTFVASSLPMHGDVNERIPRKLHAWKLACEMFEGDAIALLDCDTLVVRPFHDQLGPSWDVVYTWKDEVFPINTGVMMVREGRLGVTLFTEMLARVERMVRDASQLAVATGASGAADQHALREIVGFCNYEKDVVRTVAGRELVFRGVPCRRLNETNCRPITDDLAIVHYKTGWHPILFEGKGWTTNRPQERCRPMFDLWNRNRDAADRHLARGATDSASAAHAATYASFADGYEERGILHSEMLAVCGLCKQLDVEVVIESGRARGQSTYTLARFFEGTPTHIVSLELTRDADAAFAEERLRPFSHVELQFGDASVAIPSLLERFAGKRIAILLDGPKGQPAIDLARDAMSRSADVVACFIHDMRRATPQRATLESSPGRTFFTDDTSYVARFGSLDRACMPAPGAPITSHTWRPNMKGNDPIPSYGPTLAVMLPTPSRRTARVAQSA